MNGGVDMFRSLCTEIAKQLGADFLLYYNEDVSDPKRLRADSNQTIGVFRVVSGSIQPLPGNKGLNAVIQLDFFANVENTWETLRIDRAIDLLAINKNGKIAVETRTITETNEEKDVVIYKYLANYSVPRTIGNTQIGANSDRCIIKQVNLTIVLSNDLIFGDAGRVYLAEEEITNENKDGFFIEGALNWIPSVRNVMTDNAELGKKYGELIPQYAVKKAVITGLVSDGIKRIVDSMYSTPQKVMYFRNEIDFSEAMSIIEYKVCIEDFTITGTKGEFMGYQLTLSPIPDWLV